jgi:hypothetical protein
MAWAAVDIGREWHQPCQSDVLMRRHFGCGLATGGAFVSESDACQPESLVATDEVLASACSTTRRPTTLATGFDNLQELARIASLFQSNVLSIINTNKFKKCLPFLYFLLNLQQCSTLAITNPPLRL